MTVNIGGLLTDEQMNNIWAIKFYDEMVTKQALNLSFVCCV